MGGLIGYASKGVQRVATMSAMPAPTDALPAWVTTPENRLARAAIQRVADALVRGRVEPDLLPLMLHGAPGTGKSHLVQILAREAIRRRPDLVVSLLSASEAGTSSDGTLPEWVGPARACDLFLLEDVQHASTESMATLTRILDARLVRHRATVVTGTAGPGQLPGVPQRLAGRLAAGLVVGLEPLSPASRLILLQDRARRRGLTVGRDVLAHLSEHSGGSVRPLEGALHRLEALTRTLGRPPELADLLETFAEADRLVRPGLDRIVERVGRYFRVEPRQMRARSRGRQNLRPRQVAMHLARLLTPLSLQQIGAYFGGRDHTTVLHACRKITEEMARDSALAGAVRQLHADLG